MQLTELFQKNRRRISIISGVNVHTKSIKKNVSKNNH